MSLNIVRNDIVNMHTEAIVNTANTNPVIGPGVDSAVYKAAGEAELLKIRKEIGIVAEGDAFITPGFNLYAKYIIHTVSPLFTDGESGEEDKLRACYRNCLRLARENGISSIAFPLIATGSYGYPMADGLRIALDEINAFLMENEMDINIVVFGTRVTEMAAKIYPGLKAYIDHHYVKKKKQEEYDDAYFESYRPGDAGYRAYSERQYSIDSRFGVNQNQVGHLSESRDSDDHRELAARPKMAPQSSQAPHVPLAPQSLQASHAPLAKRASRVPQADARLSLPATAPIKKDGDNQAKSGLGSIFKTPKLKSTFKKRSEEEIQVCDTFVPSGYRTQDSYREDEEWDAYEAFPGESKLKDRIKNLSKPFGEYFFYLVEQKKLTSTEVQNGAWISKQVYHKINKNRTTYHPDKRTAMQLCVGLKLSLDESRDFLSRAGYTFSPSDLEDVIFSFFLSMSPDMYDIMDISDALEKIFDVLKDSNKYMAFSTIKMRDKTSREYIAQPFVRGSSIRLMEDVGGIPQFKESLHMTTDAAKRNTIIKVSGTSIMSNSIDDVIDIDKDDLKDNGFDNSTSYTLDPDKSFINMTPPIKPITFIESISDGLQSFKNSLVNKPISPVTFFN